MQSFMPTRFFVFEVQAIKNGFAGPKSFGAFEKRAPVQNKVFWLYFMLRIRMSLRFTKLPNTSWSGNVVRYVECNDSTVIDALQRERRGRGFESR